MKKNIIALAIASVVAAPAAFAAAPTVYGQVAVSIDSVTDAGMSVEDGASRFGVKGSEDLGNGLTAVYKMEFATAVGEAVALKGRNAYVGLAGGFGTVLLGRHDTPLKMAQPTDLFNDGAADNGKVAGNIGVSEGEYRADRVVAYVSPSFSGVTFIGAGVTMNNSGDDADQSLTNITSIALTYGSKKDGVYAAVAQNSIAADVLALGASTATETRVAVQYAKDALVANVLYTSAAADDTVVEGSNIQVGVGYTMGKMTPKFKYSTVDFTADASEDGSAIALGLDYALGKKTTTTIEYTSLDKNLAGNGTPAAKAMTTISLGLVHKF